MTAALDSGHEDSSTHSEFNADGDTPGGALPVPDGVSAADPELQVVTAGTADEDFGELSVARAAAERMLAAPVPAHQPDEHGEVSAGLHFAHEGEAAPGPYTLPTIRETFTPEGRSTSPLEADVVLGVPPEQTVDFNAISSEGDTIAVDPAILGKVVDTTREVYRLNGNRHDAYCDEFAVMLCGGAYNPTPSGDRSFFGVEPPRFAYDADALIELSDTEADERLPAMQPLEMGKLEADGTLEPYHTIVKLPGVTGMYVSKLGEGPVVLSDLPGLAAYYGTTHVVPIVKISSSSDRHGSILNYTHPSYDPTHPYTITKVPGESAQPEEPEPHEGVDVTTQPPDNEKDPWL